MNAVPKYDSLVFNEAALKLRTRRQEILTNNLANSDTPGFKARDIDFAKTLENELSGKNYRFFWASHCAAKRYWLKGSN
jgi:flagellar basal-body rod protein FlgB